MNREDLSGSKFGELLVVNEVEAYVTPRGQKYRRYFCLCSCGGTTIARQANLLNGHTKSCGCLRHTGKPKMPKGGITVCAYYPMSVDCNKLECEKCGWNPYNKELREARIRKLRGKDGTDE